MVDFIAEMVVCCEYIDVAGSHGGTKMCPSDEGSPVWSFSLLCESHNDWEVIVREESDKHHMFDLAVSQHDGK